MTPNLIEYTLLNPDVTGNQVDALIKRAIDDHVRSMCVPPFWVKRAKREIGDTSLLLSTPVGAPFGYQMTETKMTEIEWALKNGVDEIDLTFNASAFFSGMTWPKIELAKASKKCHEHEVYLKVMINASLFNVDQVVEIARTSKDAGVDIVHLRFEQIDCQEIRNYLTEYFDLGGKILDTHASSDSLLVEHAQMLLETGLVSVGINGAPK